MPTVMQTQIGHSFWSSNRVVNEEQHCFRLVKRLATTRGQWQNWQKAPSTSEILRAVGWTAEHARTSADRTSSSKLENAISLVSNHLHEEVWCKNLMSPDVWASCQSMLLDAIGCYWTALPILFPYSYQVDHQMRTHVFSLQQAYIYSFIYEHDCCWPIYLCGICKTMQSFSLSDQET